MLPLPLPGIALAGSMLLSKYNRKHASGTVRMKSIFPPIRKSKPRKQAEVKEPEGTQRRRRTFKLANPIEKLSKGNPLKVLSKANPLKSLSNGLTSGLKGLASSLSQIAKRPAAEDYQSIARNFVPGSAVLLSPQYPSVSRGIQLADLDGDTRDELIASYKLNDAVRTIILKKQEEHWYKLGEINHPEYDTVEYRNAADITGKGRRQLLMRMSSKNRPPVLYGYTVENSSVREIFSRNCHKVDIVRQQPTRGGAQKAQLAIWNRRDPAGYHIEVVNWNGSQLVTAQNASSYHYRSVAPYYAAMVKRSPHTAAHWYNLADSLVNAGVKGDASAAVRIGMEMDKGSTLKDHFIALQNRINEL